MYCPECGHRLVRRAAPETTSLAWYGPCPRCGVYWEYSSEDGTYSSRSLEAMRKIRQEQEGAAGC